MSTTVLQPSQRLDENSAKTVDGTHDKYAERAKLYAASRPQYPANLVNRLVSSTPSSHRNTVLDVAAGSGQLSTLLAGHFRHVVALDKSSSQLERGPQLANLVYRAGVATDLPLPNQLNLNHENKPEEEASFFDLVTCAQAYHYFVGEKIDHIFLAQACRVLHPDHGRIGLLGYGICTVTSSPAMDTVFQSFYRDDLGSHLPTSDPGCLWDVDRRPLDLGFPELEFFGIVEEVERHETIERKVMSLQGFLDFVRTLSAVANLRTKCALEGQMDPMEKLYRDLSTCASQDDELLQVSFPFFLIVLKPVR